MGAYRGSGVSSQTLQLDLGNSLCSARDKIRADSSLDDRPIFLHSIQSPPFQSHPLYLPPDQHRGSGAQSAQIMEREQPKEDKAICPRWNKVRCTYIIAWNAQSDLPYLRQTLCQICAMSCCASFLDA